MVVFAVGYLAVVLSSFAQGRLHRHARYHIRSAPTTGASTHNHTGL